MEDLLFLEKELNKEELLIKETVNNFVVNKVQSKINEHFLKDEFPKEWIKEIANLGLLGMNLPENYGGSSASYVSYGLVCQELEKADSGLRSFVSVQNSLCIYPIFRYGSLEQKNNYLKNMASGEIIGCFGLTEPDSGSDPASLNTIATKVKGGWLLNGSKMWITNAPIADIAIIWAKTESGIRGFIVESKYSGFATNTIKNKLSLRASYTGEIVLTDCFVPDAQILPGSDIGLKAALSCLTQARYGIAFGAMGAAKACFMKTREYCLERKQFGKSIASFQLVQKELADMFTEIVKADCLNLQIGRLKDKNSASPVMISMAKMNSCREALKIARNCRNLLGANGISLEYDVIRHMNNLESVFTYEGTDNIHHLILGQYITGINAFV